MKIHDLHYSEQFLFGHKNIVNRCNKVGKDRCHLIFMRQRIIVSEFTIVISKQNIEVIGWVHTQERANKID